MAFIRQERANSGIEATLKVLAVLTEDIKLVNGAVYLSSGQEGGFYATKASLFIEVSPLAKVGLRNVWIREAGESVQVTCADERSAIVFLGKLYTTHQWDESIPQDHRRNYSLKNLDKAATDIRNYLLFGVLPNIELDDYRKTYMAEALKVRETDDTTVIDILATLFL